MSTLEALAAISEAIQAHAKLPEVEIKLKEMTELAEFRQLELDEAREEIARLKQWNSEQLETIYKYQAEVLEQNSTISELRERNAMIDAGLTAMTNTTRSLEQDRNEKVIVIDMQRDEINRLEARLAESKSVTARLTDTLKSIGASIVSAVAEPEVSTPPTFRDPMAMPDPASSELDGSLNNQPVEPVVEPTGQVVVSETIVTETGAEAIHHKPEPVAAGCNVYRYW